MSSVYAETYMRAIKDADVKKSLIALTKERRTLPSLVVCIAIVLLTASGMDLACLQNGYTVVIAIFLIAVAKILGWYLSHDCAHNCAFKSKIANSMAGECLAFLNGLSFFSFEGYREDHVRHHAERIDIGGFDSISFAEAHPRVFGGIKLTERIYIPTCYYLIKIVGVYRAIRGDSRRESARAVGSVCLYMFTFFAFARSSYMLILVWQLSSFVRIHVVRFVDCFQHSFQQIYGDGQKLSNSKLYEIQNTFSVPVARKYTYLNLLILNFGYHTAHHCFPSCPWYTLPKLDAAITARFVHYGVIDVREEGCSVFDFMSAYHRGRIVRLTTDDEGHAYDAEGRFSTSAFTGAYTDKLLG